MSSPLRDYQRDGVLAAMPVLKATQGFYVQHPPGAGKTLTAIAVARLLKAYRIVVICPVVAQGVWQREMRKWWPTFAVESADDPEHFMHVCSFDALDKERIKPLAVLRPDLLIVDEGQYVKNPTAERTQRVMELARSCTYKLYLSGTAAHSPIDWYAPFRIIAPHEPVFQQTYTQFKKELAVMGGPTGNWPMKDKAGNLKVKKHIFDMVNQIVGRYSHFAPNALDDLPEAIYTEVPVELSEREQAIYDRMRDILRVQLPDDTEASAEIVLTKLMRLAQIAAGHVTNDAGDTVVTGDSKLRACMELLDMRPDQKVIVACRFRKDIERIRDELNRQGRACSIITGETPEKYRTQYVEWFQTHEGNGVMLLQYRAGGVAITLTEARTLILYTLEPSVIAWQQIIGRIFRIGQQHAVEIISLLAEGTQDWATHSALQAGADQVNIARLLLNQLHEKR